eukprot:446485-Rhodomonas_salina.2
MAERVMHRHATSVSVQRAPAMQLLAFDFAVRGRALSRPLVPSPISKQPPSISERSNSRWCGQNLFVAIYPRVNTSCGTNLPTRHRHRRLT